MKSGHWSHIALKSQSVQSASIWLSLEGMRIIPPKCIQKKSLPTRLSPFIIIQKKTKKFYIQIQLFVHEIKKIKIRNNKI